MLKLLQDEHISQRVRMGIPWAKSLSAGRRLPSTPEFHKGRSSSRLLRVLVAVIVTLAIPGYVPAQVDINPVPVFSRTSPASLAPRQHIVRTDVDLVLVNLTVLDRAGRTVSGLKAANFAVLDERDPQVIRYLSSIDEPMSLVVILDASASMASKVQKTRDAVTDLVNASNPQDDFSLIIVWR